MRIGNRAFKIDPNRPHKSQIVKKAWVEKHTLVKVFQLYKSAQFGKFKEDYIKRVERFERIFCKLFGNYTCVSQIMPKDVRSFINSELERGMKTSTISDSLSIVCAATEWYLREHDIPVRNPFYRPPIPRKKHDQTPVPAVPMDRLAGLRSLCYLLDDDIRWLLAILIDTGARLSEVSGCALSDLRAYDDPPHLVIQERPWRRIKTRYSRRVIPLAGIALWAAKRVLATTAPGQIAAFPRYINNDRLRSASSSYRTWLKDRDINCGVHGFRHTFLDRLRDLDCPVDIRRSLLGWATNTTEGRYGFGPSIQVKAKWVSAVVPEDFAALKNLAHLPGSTGNRDTGCANAHKLVEYLSAQGRKTVPEILASGMFGSKDLKNALRYARKHGAVDIATPMSIEHSHRHRYFVTGSELPSQPLKQPMRRPSPLGCSLPAASKLGLEPAQCFSQPIRPQSQLARSWPAKRLRPGLIRKYIVRRIGALPSQPDVPSPRDCADRVIAAMELESEYSRDALRDVAKVTEIELCHALNYLYTYGVTRSHWTIVGGVKVRHTFLTGRPMPRRNNRPSRAISRTRTVFVESDSASDWGP